MAAEPFRFTDNNVLTINQTGRTPQSVTPVITPSPVIHFSDFSLFSPHLTALWITPAEVDGLPLDQPCRLARIIDHQALQLSQLSIANRYTDNKFNLPKGFLASHPTVLSVLKCDTKLLPHVPVSPGPFLEQFQRPFVRPKPTPALRSLAPDDFELYTEVIRYQCPNYRGAQRDIDPSFPHQLWDELLSSYSDKQVVTYMRYGWPTSYMGQALPILDLKNHASSVRQPEAVSSFLSKELRLGGLAGPFTESPFEWLRQNPLMTREKKVKDEYRVILDLSFLEGLSVNSSIPKLLYDGSPYKLHLPTSLDLASLIVKHGPGALMFKIDLSRQPTPDTSNKRL